MRILSTRLLGNFSATGMSKEYLSKSSNNFVSNPYLCTVFLGLKKEAITTATPTPGARIYGIRICGAIKFDGLVTEE